MQQRLLKALTLLGLVSLSYQAFAAGASPQAGAWVVSPIHADDGPASFCSMKNSFQNGHMLVLARDTGGGDQVAVDFGKKTIEAGHQYDIALAAGTATREITGVGATPQVLLINMAGDAAFAAALAGASVLRLTALNATYEYSMAGAGDALPALQECVDGLRPHKKSSHPHPAVAAAEAEKPALDDRKIMAELKELHAANDALKNRVEAVAQQRQEEDKSAKAAADLAAANRKLAAENEKLKQTLAAARDKQERESDLKQQALASLQQENAQLQKKLAAPKPAAGLDKILIAARVVPPSAQAAQSGGAVTYHWQDDNLFVSAEETHKDKGFDQTVSAWFDKMASRCKGDFAHVADAPRKAHGLTLQKAEMACIDDRNDAAASLLFVGDSSGFAVITREGSKDQMETAMAARNASAAVLQETN